MLLVLLLMHCVRVYRLIFHSEFNKSTLQIVHIWILSLFKHLLNSLSRSHFYMFDRKRMLISNKLNGVVGRILYNSFNVCVRKLVWVRSRTCQPDLEMLFFFLLFVSPLCYALSQFLSHSVRLLLVSSFVFILLWATTMFRVSQLVKCIDHVR